MAETDLSQERIAENVASFREKNEKIEAAAHNIELPRQVRFICECPNPACVEIVRLT